MMKGVVYISILLFVILAVAVIMDMLFDKIYNEWICLAIATGLSCALWKGGISGLLWALLSMTVPVFLLYPLFMTGCLGAGDVKLLAAAGCFLGVKDVVVCLGISFAIGAVFSLFKMMMERNFLQRIRYLTSYIREVVQSGEWKLYEQDVERDTIHFTLPILLGVVLYEGGICR